MKFSSDDILQQQFESRFRGYDPDQVHEFLDGMARDWDQAHDEIKRLTREAAAREQELKEYRRRDRSLHDALDMAKNMAEELRHQAKRDAELIIAEAELRAERILADSESELAEMRHDLVRVRQQRIRFEAELRALLDAHGRLVDEFGTLESEVIEDEDIVTETAAEPF